MKDELPEYILDALMRSMDFEDASASKQEESNHIFSLRFRYKMHRLLRRSHGPKPGNPHLTMKNRLIIALLTIILLGALFISSVSGWKLELFRMVEQKFPEYSKLSFMEISDMDISDDLFCKYAPSYIPEGFEVEKEYVAPSYFRINYRNAKNDFITYSQAKLKNIHSTLNTEGNQLVELELNGYVSYFFTNKNIHYLIWSDSIYTFKISSILGKEELLKIAKSNKLIKN